MLRNDLQRITSLFFTSRVRVKIMKLFFTNPREKFHMRKIARDVNEQINAVRRELISMEKSDFLISQKDGIKKYYTLNPSFPFYNELRSILVKAFGLGQLVFLKRKELGNIKFAILSHTYLNREDSDISNPDMLVVGEPDLNELDKVVKEAEQIEGKNIYYSVISEHDLDTAKKRRDPLIYSLSVLPRAMIIGTDEEFVV